MNAIQAIVNGALMMVLYMGVFGILYKVMSISKELAEVKRMLEKRSRDNPDPYFDHAARIAQAPAREWTVLDPEG